MLAELDTSLGRPRAALRLLRNYRGDEFAILTAMPRARAHLALGDLRAAQGCVRSVLAIASALAGRFMLVEALLCDAQIAQLSDDPGRALEVLIRALEIARGEIILPFLQAEGRCSPPCWPGILPSPPSGPYLVRVLRGEPARSAVISGVLPEPLTQRELTVLRFLATSMSTMEIADELCLSVNTVKTHMAAIYRKLPAGRRREAVLRARELELI